MKNLMKTLLLLMAISFYPFGCEAQVNGTIPVIEGCDTVEIESPKMQEAIETATKTIADLSVLLDEQKLIVSTKSNEISALKTDFDDMKETAERIQDLYVKSQDNVDRLLDTIHQKDLRINSLISELAEKPTTVTDTIYQESEFITVQGVEYRVADIQNILPDQTVDTINIGWCTDDHTTRDYFHEGPIDTYPHFINFASANKGMIKVWFTEPLTDEIKAQDSINVQRIISHKIGLTQYIYLGNN